MGGRSHVVYAYLHMPTRARNARMHACIRYSACVHATMPLRLVCLACLVHLVRLVCLACLVRPVCLTCLACRARPQQRDRWLMELPEGGGIECARSDIKRTQPRGRNEGVARRNAVCQLPTLPCFTLLHDSVLPHDVTPYSEAPQEQRRPGQRGQEAARDKTTWLQRDPTGQWASASARPPARTAHGRTAARRTVWCTDACTRMGHSSVCRLEAQRLTTLKSVCLLYMPVFLRNAFASRRSLWCDTERHRQKTGNRFLEQAENLVMLAVCEVLVDVPSHAAIDLQERDTLGLDGATVHQNRAHGSRCTCFQKMFPPISCVGSRTSVRSPPPHGCAMTFGCCSSFLGGPGPMVLHHDPQACGQCATHWFHCYAAMPASVSGSVRLPGVREAGPPDDSGIQYTSHPPL